MPSGPDLRRPENGRGTGTQINRIVFGLDPDEAIDFEPVKTAALDLKRHLKALGLASYPLLAPGQAVRVVVPLTPDAEWHQVRDFARGLGSALAEAEPDRFIIALPKPKRKGRILLEYLRNQRTAMAIMPYSARARAGAPVGWDELEAFTTPRRFGIAHAARCANTPASRPSERGEPENSACLRRRRSKAADNPWLAPALI